MLKLVWDTSALVNLKEADDRGYSPAYSLWKDLADGWIVGPYCNILPVIAAFELTAAVSNKRRNGSKMLPEFYLMGQHEVLFPVDERLLKRSFELIRAPGFDRLRGADLIFACIAKLEDALLVTLDNGFKHVAGDVRVLDLNDSRVTPRYRNQFEMLQQGS